MRSFCHIALCADISYDMEHPSVFDDDSDFDFILNDPHDPIEALIDSPSLSPIATPADLPLQDDFTLPDASFRGGLGDVDQNISKQGVFTTIRRFLEQSPFGWLLRFFRFLCSLCFSCTDKDHVENRIPRTQNSKESSSSTHRSHADQHLPGLAMHHVDYDACLVSIYSPEFILESIAAAERKAAFFNPDEELSAPCFSNESPYDFPSAMFQSSWRPIGKTGQRRFEDTSESDHRLHALLRCEANPIECAAVNDGIGIPRCIHFPTKPSNATLHSFMSVIHKGSAAELTDVSLVDGISLKNGAMRRAEDFAYVTFGEIKHWLEVDSFDFLEKKITSTDQFLSKLRLLETFAVPEETLEALRVAASREGNNGEDATFFNENENENNVHKQQQNLLSADHQFFLTEFHKRFGADATEDLSAVGVFMAPRDANSRLLRGLHSINAAASSQRVVNGTAVATVYAQESYRFTRVAQDGSEIKRLTRRKRYRFHIPEDRMFTLLLTCPVGYRQ